MKRTGYAQYNNLFETNPEQQAALAQLRKSNLNRHMTKNGNQPKDSQGSSLAVSRQTLNTITREAINS